MIFTNKPNRQIKTEDGQEVWIARDSAVVMLVAIYRSDLNEFFVLMGKRGPACPDEIGKWTMPCGYLDYDETLGEAAIRETWEECGVNIFKLLEIKDSEEYKKKNWDLHSKHDVYLEDPWRINSKPETNSKQNVSNYFCCILNDIEFPKTNTNHCEEGEVDEIRWISLQEIKGMHDAGDIGFNHYFAMMQHPDLKLMEE